MPVLSLACHLPHNTPNIPSRYNNEQTTKQTKAINNSYIYISHVNVTQTVPDISPLMPMHQDPLLVCILIKNSLTLNICSKVFRWQFVAIGFGNGLSPSRLQAAAGHNGNSVLWCVWVTRPVGINCIGIAHLLIQCCSYSCFFYLS